jgi:hypothetical protein
VSRNRPPSEKLSGVTLRTPTSTGRSHRSLCGPNSHVDPSPGTNQKYTQLSCAWERGAGRGHWFLCIHRSRERIFRTVRWYNAAGGHCVRQREESRESGGIG